MTPGATPKQMKSDGESDRGHPGAQGEQRQDIRDHPIDRQSRYAPWLVEMRRAQHVNVSALNEPASMREPLARRLLRAAVGDYSLAADDALPGDDQRDPAGGQIDIGAAAETDEAET